MASQSDAHGLPKGVLSETKTVVDVNYAFERLRNANMKVSDLTKFRSRDYQCLK